MTFKLINATDVKIGTPIMIKDDPCIVKKLDMSKTGKHGHAKMRIEASGIFDDKKRVFVVPGHERFEVPEIGKSKGQVLNIGEDKANIMDLKSFETTDAVLSPEIKQELKEGDSIEYWNVDGKKIIKRKI
jgi:translation initiation factor 5A